MTRTEKCIRCKIERLKTLDYKSYEFIDLAENINKLIIDGIDNNILEEEIFSELLSLLVKVKRFHILYII
jgi:hypothetical protein